jgi:hypothetical protein
MKRFILAQLVLLLIILATIPVLAYVSSQPPGYTAVSCGAEVQEDTGTILRLVQSRMRRTEDATEAVAMTEMICRVASRHGLRPTLVAAVVDAESNFNPRAKSHCGARGLMQIMPYHYEWLQIADPYDPEQNLNGGCLFLSRLIAKYGGNEVNALRHYNGGASWYNPETRAYWPKVLRIEAKLTTRPRMPQDEREQMQREKIFPSQERGKEAAKIYRVRAGDTLWRIAQRYGTTVEELARRNGIENPDVIEIGQRVVIR